MNDGFSWLRRTFTVRLLVVVAPFFILTALGAPMPPVNWGMLKAEDAAPNQLLVRFDPARAQKEKGMGRHAAGATRHLLAATRTLGATVETEFSRIPWQVISIPPGVGLAAAAAAYTADPAVVAVEPNYIVRASATPNDPAFSELWGMERIGALAAWDTVTGTAANADDIVVAVIDTGIRYTHEDLSSNMWVNPSPTFGDIYGARWTDGTGNPTSGDPMDRNGHGTRVAGTIGAVGNNKLGVVGVNWRVKLMALKFLDDFGEGKTADAIAAIEYAIVHGAHLSNNSWDGFAYSEALRDAIFAAGAANQLFVAAAGNDVRDNDTQPNYPSSYENDNIIAVASIDESGELSSFSCYGATSVDIAAPGNAILSCVSTRDSAYDTSSGTSMAAPHVAGAAALLLALQPTAAYAEIRDILYKSARPNSALLGKMTTSGELALDQAIATFAGSITLDRTAYRSDAAVAITVTDVGVVDTQNTVTVSWSTTNASSERASGTLDLARDGTTSSFNIILQLDSGVTAVHDDLLLVSYTDSHGRLLVKTAPIDDIPPVLANLRIEEVSDERLVVYWETDEPASSGCSLGTNVPPAMITQTNVALVTSHAVEFTNLDACTRYHAAVWSLDAAGNRADLPADVGSADPAAYAVATTRGRNAIYTNDFALGRVGWTTTNLYGNGEACWEYGIPNYGPFPASRCWGTRINGRHPSSVNAVLVSPRFKVGDWPVIRFSQWAEMSWTSVFGNMGFVEVRGNGGWENVTEYSDRYAGRQAISGGGGWEDVTIRLPATFTNQTLQVRFRFQADGDSPPEGNPPGWYIDNFSVKDVLLDGLVIASLSLDDTVGGNGDGLLSPGETVEIDMVILNLTEGALTNVTGALVARSAGAAHEQPQLLNGSPARVDYGTIAIEDFATAQPAAPLLLRLPETMAPGTVISLFQTLKDSKGKVYETRYTLKVALPPVPLGGPGGSSAFNAPDETLLPEAEPRDSPLLPLFPAPSASFSVSGTVTCDYLPDNNNVPNPPLVGVPVTGAVVRVEDVLGDLVADAETDDTGAYVITNLTDGPLWIVVTPPVANPRFIGPAGEALILTNDVIKDFALRQDGIEAPYNSAPRLVLRSLVTNDVTYGNGNGRIDPGERLVVSAYLDNVGTGTASKVTGVLQAADMGVPDVMTVTMGVASNLVNIPGSSNPLHPALLTPLFEVVVDAAAPRGAIQRFTLVATDTGSAPARSWPFDFTLQVDPHIAVTGTVAFADGRNTTNHFHQTRVRLALSNDYDRTVGVNSTGGYIFEDVPGEVTGTVSVVGVPGDYASPPAIEIGPLFDDTVIPEIMIPLLALSVSADLSFVIAEGQSATGTLTVVNNGTEPVSMLVDRVYQRISDEAIVPPTPLAALAVEGLAIPAVDWTKVSPDTCQANEVIVRFAAGVTRAEQETILAQNGLVPVFFFNAFPAALARRVQGATTMQTLSVQATTMENDPRIILVAPNDRAQRMSTPTFPNDYEFIELYGLFNERQTGGTKGADIRAPWAWTESTGSRQVVVAVCDSGVRIDHPDLADNIWRNPYPGTSPDITGDINGWNFYDWNNDVSDGLGHGTHVAGTIGAVGDNGIGVAGVNWKVSLMVCRLSDAGGGFTTAAHIAKAIEYAVENGAHVSNHSWGGYDTAGVIGSAIAYARDNNHLVVASAGNDAQDLDTIKTYPAYYSTVYDNVITVAATDHDDELAYFSNFGAESVQIAAPGVDIFSTLREGDYGKKSGTSMACPHVTGAAALLWSLAPDASYKLIKDALLKGVRYDPNLEGWVKESGHLDVQRAMVALGADWLTVEPVALTLAPGESTNLTVVVNDPPQLVSRPAAYKATIELRDINDAFTLSVPVSVQVTNGLWLALEEMRLVNQKNYADTLAPSPGDTVELWLTLRNLSSQLAVSLQGTLAGGGASVITQGSVSWDYLYGQEAAEATMPLLVTLDPAATGDLTFTLAMTIGGKPAGTFQLTVPVLLGASLSGRVLTPEAAPVAAARVEVWGAHGAEITTLTNGAFLLRGLSNGVYSLRVIPVAHERSSVQTVTIAGADVVLADIMVHAPHITFDETVAVTVIQGQTNSQTLTIFNTNTTNVAAGPFTWSVYTSPLRRVAVISDGQTLLPAVAPLQAMGFEVSRFTNNFDRVQLFRPDNPYYPFELIQNARYTDDEAFLAQFDAVVLDLTGPKGHGRLLTDGEFSTLEAFADRGGVVVFTGANPLSRPDNDDLAALMDVDNLDRDAVVSDQAQALTNWVSPFLSLSGGARLNTTALAYDVATILPEDGVSVLFAVDGNNKLIRNEGLNNGVMYLWTGNPDDADWADQGLWQDVLRGILWRELVAASATDVSWLSLSATNGLLAVGQAAELGLTFNAAAAVPEGTHEASLMIVGNYPGADVRAVRVTLDVQVPTFRAYTTGQVRDVMGEPLPGDGSVTSALFQVIWAGADGVINPPGLDGAPTGDDSLLAVALSGLPEGRFGVGYEVLPDAGRFNEVFAHAVTPTAPQSNVYVRAWDGASFEASFAYGDSHLYALEFLEDEAHDFGSWSVTNTLRYSRDSNGDSLPDGWVAEYRPALNPTGPIQPLESGATYTGKVNLAQSGGSGIVEPYQVVASTNFLFVLDRANSRIVIVNRATLATNTYGASGSGNSQFYKPEGLALDPRPGYYRLAVADTQNHRIQVFTFNPDTGALAWTTNFGGLGTANGKFNKPAGVAIENITGNIYVADTDNNRVQVFSRTGVFQRQFGAESLEKPQGIAADPTLGVFVADTDHKRVVHFTSTGLFVMSFGTLGELPGQFMNPVDVRIWTHTSPSGATVKRLAVADSLNNRIQLFTPAGAYLLSIGSAGNFNGGLAIPYGSFPVADTNLIYVADTGNARIQWFNVALDADGDGMNDFWEDVTGLDSSRNDALEDPDGDGLLNIGEFGAGTDPLNGDTNGNGVGDLTEIYHGFDPTDPNSGLLPGDVPVYIGLAATPVSVTNGATVVVTLVVDRALPGDAEMWLTLSGSSPLAAHLMQTADGEIFTYTHTTLIGQDGWTDGAAFCGYVNPPGYTQTNLFEVTAVASPLPLDPFPILALSLNPPQITWDAVVGGVYRIERSLSLLPTDWQEVATVTAVTPTMVRTIPFDQPIAFFRIIRTE